MIYHVEKTCNAFSRKICGKDSKNISEIRKHCTKQHIFLCTFTFWDFGPKSEKSKPKEIVSFSEKPIALIRNVGSQPLAGCEANVLELNFRANLKCITSYLWFYKSLSKKKKLWLGQL